VVIGIFGSGSFRDLCILVEKSRMNRTDWRIWRAKSGVLCGKRMNYPLLEWAYLLLG
jgi:hypothetical protein